MWHTRPFSLLSKVVVFCVLLKNEPRTNPWSSRWCFPNGGGQKRVLEWALTLVRDSMRKEKWEERGWEDQDISETTQSETNLRSGLSTNLNRSYIDCNEQQASLGHPYPEPPAPQGRSGQDATRLSISISRPRSGDSVEHSATSRASSDTKQDEDLRLRHTGSRWNKRFCARYQVKASILESLYTTPFSLLLFQRAIISLRFSVCFNSIADSTRRYSAMNTRL